MDDTIVAISSATGPAARSIVRLSGPDAFGLAERIFSELLKDKGGFRTFPGVVTIKEPYPISVPARAYLFRAPRSYTRQDVVELHVPGEVVASIICSTLISAGARQAQPGEFTARAFLLNRIDLSCAQAVADVIDASSDAQLRSAISMLEGTLTKLCNPIVEALTEALAIIEASIDFADEDIELASVDELVSIIERCKNDIEKILSQSGQWSVASKEIPLVIAGRANVGKSSLLNALTGMDRAIVSAIAGTTRDVLSAPTTIKIENVPNIPPGEITVMVHDVAGLESASMLDDPLMIAAHQAARQAVRTSVMILFVVDATHSNHDADEQLFKEIIALNSRADTLIIANKVDLLINENLIGDIVAKLSSQFGCDVLPVSAKTHRGFDELRKTLAERLVQLAAPQSSALLLHEHQRRSLAAAAESVDRAIKMLKSIKEITDSAELLAVELRAALANLGEITGQITTEDILSEIFSRFCIGK
ncbi:MAG: tRNA modification GTPase [Planctomycetes bacterium]|nr:tRNA modification GTPase [Planctomycetota bacterium]